MNGGTEMEKARRLNAVRSLVRAVEEATKAEICGKRTSRTVSYEERQVRLLLNILLNQEPSQADIAFVSGLSSSSFAGEERS